MADFRKILRWVVNIATLVAAVITLPAFGAFVPVAWMPQIASAAAAINLVLTWMRNNQSGEGILTKPF